jgi:hypothetical protein
MFIFLGGFSVCLTNKFEFDAEALSIILKIEEPETFKIGEDSLSPEIREKITKYKSKFSILNIV